MTVGVLLGLAGCTLFAGGVFALLGVALYRLVRWALAFLRRRA